jgi:hypothetical protein
MFTRIVRVTVVVLAGVALAVPMPAFLVERLYSRHAYLLFQAFLTPITNGLPFALFDVVVASGVIAVLVALFSLIRDVRSLRGLWKLAWRVVVALATVYLAFLVCWGLNYQRQPFTAKFDFAADRAQPRAVLDLATEVVGHVNALYEQAHAEGYPDWGQLPAWLATAFVESQSDLAPGRQAVPGVPKISLLSLYFERAGIDGMTDPFFLEILVNQRLLPVERPFVVAHEWAHLAGYADESEANFLGWLTCLRGPVGAQYSGWLFIYSHALHSLAPGDRARIEARLGAGPRDDLQAIDRRLRSIQPAVSTVSWRVYDRYLRANRVESGVASYDRVILLLLGTRFGPGWVPIKRLDTWAPSTGQS